MGTLIKNFSIRNVSRKLVLSSLILLAPFQVNSATITMYGDDVSFTFDDATLFGEANVIGNSIFFLPTSFSALSQNGDGAVSTNQTLNIEIEATTAGFNIETLGLYESGDYKLSGTDASADVQGMFAATSLTKLDPSSFLGLQPYREEQLFSTGSLADTAGVLTQWSASASIDLASISGWGSDTLLTATVENLLSVNTLNLGEDAFLEKKFGGIGIVVNAVPVPAAIWLFGSGLIGLVGLARRKKA